MERSDLEPTVESKVVYRGRIVNLRVDTVRLPGDRLATREIAEHSHSVCMVPVDDNGNVLLVKQYRKPVEAQLLEVPAGGIEEGEIFGAMAVLTNADRTATVMARDRCSVVKVPKEQFADLIKSNPTTIHSLLIDMANSIVNLNEQLVGLRGSYMN